jgi:fucose permease
MGAIPAEIFAGPDFGAIFGTVMLAAILGGAAGPWITGVVYDATGMTRCAGGAFGLIRLRDGAG